VPVLPDQRGADARCDAARQVGFIRMITMIAGGRQFRSPLSAASNQPLRGTSRQGRVVSGVAVGPARQI